MVTFIALVIQLIVMGLGNQSAPAPVIIPAMPLYAPTVAVTEETDDWELYNQEAYYDYASEFTAIYGAVAYKVSKNGRSMVRSANGGPFKFAAKGIK